MNNQSTHNDSLNGATKVAKDFKKDVEGKVTEYGNELNKFSEVAGKKVGEMAAQVKTVADEYLSTGKEYIERGENYVKTNPERSLAMAIGVGAVIGGIIAYALRKK
jgi:ElaB/YqjD/DUF883 family membrane-anchored ribosome-binding protein